MAVSATHAAFTCGSRHPLATIGEVLTGYATPAGTARLLSRFPEAVSVGFYRQVQELEVSSLGIGTYLGTVDDATDRSYTSAILGALAGGINIVDTSLNYRNQRSERAIGAALETWIAQGGARDEFVICTKAGYLTPGAIAATLPRDEVVAGMHCLAPAFLSDQLERSRRNLGLETIDVFYLHNPETQLAHVPEDIFYARIQSAFEWLETAADSGLIRYYGCATWDGFRRGAAAGALSLAHLDAIARDIGGATHRFRFVQAPVNLAMVEALSKPLREGASLTESAPELGLTVVSSASLLQGRLSRNLPDEVAAAMPHACTDAQRALQFTRSCPGVSVALAGMSKPEHVEENLGLARFPPMTRDEMARALA